MKLGISTYSLTWSIGVPGYPAPAAPLGALDLLRIAAERRIRLVQFADNLRLALLSKSELERIRDCAEHTGIAVELGTRGTEPERLLEYLRLARYFGCTLCRTLIENPDLAAAERQIRQVIPAFAESGVSLAIENHGLHTTGQLAGLFNRLDSPFVGCCLDTVNSFGALESPDLVIQALAPYVINLHIKDFNISRVDHQMGFVVLGTPAGAGKLNIDRLLQIIHNEKRQPTAILELWTPFSRTIEETVRLEREWFVQSLDYLQKFHFD
jgi:sugar phosphate isomerase/epimerase